MLSGFKEQRSNMEDEETGRKGQKRRRDVHDASKDEETSGGQKRRRDVHDASKDEETSGGQKRRRDVHDASKDEETSGGQRRRRDVHDASKDEETSGGQKRRRDVIDPSKDEETSMKKRRIGPGPEIIWVRHHEDQEEEGYGEDEVIPILDSSEEKTSAIKTEEQGKEDLPYPGSTISDNIKRLTFHHVLGRGSYGQVVLAEDIYTRQEFAVKVIAKRSLLNEGKERVTVERRVLQLASGSPFLIQGHFALQTNGHVLLGMEYITCGDFHHLLQQKGRLTIANARFYAAELLCGLQHLHSKGIIHRDLKPGNILVAATGHVKICDFGLAIWNTCGERLPPDCVGTPGFVAPEMLAGEEYDAGIDWFAFGIILNIMVTGKARYHQRRFKASNMEAKTIIKELLEEDPDNRLGVNGDIRAHPFFEDINWDSVQALGMEPPHTPSEENIRRGFRPFDINKMKAEEKEGKPLSAEEQALFAGFSFITSDWKTLDSAPAP
ncbi:protein kinase C delta type-like [Dendropsophus ebraccatus]|uniref:protein kinase C delta type-like n=1 Tax=Dendropsophus ebraccatus TaxID=150705 RepID=UPI003831DF37